MDAHGHGDFELGADTVRARDKYRLFPFFAVEGKQRAKTADAPSTPGVKVRLAW